jgi:hypothetical protein
MHQSLSPGPGGPSYERTPYLSSRPLPFAAGWCAISAAREVQDAVDHSKAAVVATKRIVGDTSAPDRRYAAGSRQTILIYRG